MHNEIKFSCSSCGQHIACAVEHAGVAIACPSCQAGLVVPARHVPVGLGVAALTLRPNRATWKSMGMGLGIAVLVAYVPFLNWIFHYLGTIVHELGHWAVAMAFGYPSVPAFHVQEGGVTLSFSRWPLLLLGGYAFWGWVLWWNRRHRLGLVVVGGVAGAYAALAHSGFDQAAVLAAGHSAQLLIAGVFLYRAWSGASILAASERPFYAAVGLHMVGAQLGFAARALFSSGYRRQYIEREEGINDFVRLSERLSVPLDLLFAGVLLGALAALGLSFLASWHQPRWRRAWNRFRLGIA